MNSYIKKIIKKLYSLPFIWRTIGSFFRAEGVIVLMYHRIGGEDNFFPSFSVEQFEIQMKWIKNNCNVIHPNNFKSNIKTNKKNKPNVLITFDDGYRCCYEYAYPILRKLNIPALVFLATQPPDDGGLIWTDELYIFVKTTTEKSIILPWDEITFSLNNDQDKSKVLTKMKDFLKNVNNETRIEYMKNLKILFNVHPNTKLKRQMLSWDEVRESLDMVCYGGHTHSHPIMSKINEKELELEIKTCSDRINSETGITPTSFAYPNGSKNDYNKLCIKLLKKYGYNLAYTTNEGFNDINTNLMEIKRTPTSANKLEDFIWLMSFNGNN